MCRTLRCFQAVLLLFALSGIAVAAVPKIHVITFGKWMSVKCFSANDETEPRNLKVRPLIVDGRVKEYTLGSPHEVTERLFVVQRAFRLNDSLPEDSGAPRWQWQRGGWLLVDRSTGHISAINLAEFDSYYSAASWYRDYVAYCGVSEDGKKISAVVVQLNRRKAVLKKLLSETPARNDGPKADGAAKPTPANDGAAADLACPPPAWQRAPVRVSFEPSGDAKQTFAIRGHVVDLVNDAEDEEEAAK
jgi:hypothetical protein